jgi:ATP-dependent Lhr-like helicase
LPISRPLELESFVIFGGRRWKVRNVDLTAKVIEVIPDKGGKPPEFDGLSGKVHDRVREEMRQVLTESALVPFLDQKAAVLLTEARENFMRLGLNTRIVIRAGGGVRLFSWKGDWVTDTLALALRHRGYKVENEGLCLNLRNVDENSVSDTLFDLSEDAFPTEAELASGVLNKVQEKWDWLLRDSLLSRNYASHNLDIPGAKRYFQELASQGAFKSYSQN